MKKRIKKSHNGFTLVEIIVSLGIFAIVAVVALGAMVKIVTANKKAQTIQSALTNINYALETISREMRVGRSFFCDTQAPHDQSDFSYSNTCPTGKQNMPNVYMAFLSSRIGTDSLGATCNLITLYKFSSAGSGNYSLSKSEQSDCEDDNFAHPSRLIGVVDPNVTISDYYVKVVADNSRPFPLATIRLTGFTGTTEKDKTYFDMQTSVSGRTI